MVKKAHEMVSELRSQMRGGEGIIELLHVFKPEEIAGKARLFARITLAPGCSIGMHQHVDEDEIFYILSGTGAVEEDGVKGVVSAGDAVLTGGGASHAIANNGNEPLVMMAVILLYK